MTFEAAVLSALSGYAVFKGRARRSEFWWFQLFCVLVYVAILCAGTLFVEDEWTLLVLVLVWLGLLVPWISLSVRRLHDVGLSGGWLFLLLLPFGGIPWVVVMVMLSLAPDTANAYGAPPGPPAATFCRALARAISASCRAWRACR